MRTTRFPGSSSAAPPAHRVPDRWRQDRRLIALPHRKLLPRHARHSLQSGLRAGRMRALDDAQKEAEMKRFHVHVGVEDLERSILFCSGLFGAEPRVRKPDYAKWSLSIRRPSRRRVRGDCDPLRSFAAPPAPRSKASRTHSCRWRSRIPMPPPRATTYAFARCRSAKCDLKLPRKKYQLSA
jgi:hypothetical protein